MSRCSCFLVESRIGDRFIYTAQLLIFAIGRRAEYLRTLRELSRLAQPNAGGGTVSDRCGHLMSVRLGQLGGAIRKLRIVQAECSRRVVHTVNLTVPVRLSLWVNALTASTKKPQAFRPGAFSSVSGAPGGIRTHDPCLRRAVLYPAELLVQRATSYLGRLGASMPGFGVVCQCKCRFENPAFHKAVTSCKRLAWRFGEAVLWFPCDRGCGYVDLKCSAIAAFLFFFSNALLSFNPFEPRIRLRFQTLLIQVLSRTRFESCAIHVPAR